jgi:DNA replication initiation complex subunit (GINS family)
MPAEHREMIQKQYVEFMQQNKEKKERQRREQEEQQRQQQQQQESYPKPPEGISPKALGMKRDPATATVPLTKHVSPRNTLI